VITDLTINSPVSGYITEKTALPNMYAQPDSHLYTVSDLSDVWVLAQVFQSDAGKIKPGDHAGSHCRCISRKGIFPGESIICCPKLMPRHEHFRVAW